MLANIKYALYIWEKFGAFPYYLGAAEKKVVDVESDMTGWESPGLFREL